MRDALRLLWRAETARPRVSVFSKGPGRYRPVENVLHIESATVSALVRRGLATNERTSVRLTPEGLVLGGRLQREAAEAERARMAEHGSPRRRGHLRVVR